MLRRALALLLAVSLPVSAAGVSRVPGNPGASSPAPAVAPIVLPPALPPGMVLPENPVDLAPVLGAPGLPEAAIPAAPAAAAGDVAASAAVPITDLQTAAAAVAGDEQAGEKKPGLAALGSDAPAPEAGAEEQSLGGSAFFNQKVGALDDPDAPAVSLPQAGAARGNGRGRGRAKKDEEPPAPPQFPARDVAFNGQVFPSVAFRPDRPVEPLIVQAIDAAKESIDVAIYEFKSQAILKALRAAKARGVKIRLVVDFENVFPVKREGNDYVPHRSVEMQSLFNEGFDVTVLRGMWRYGIMHNKFAVFDGKLGLFGSYNWTYTSERNHYENLRFTDEPARLAGLSEYWTYLRSLSAPFSEARVRVWPKEVPPPPAASATVDLNGTPLPAWVFSPGDAEGAIVRAIDAAAETLDVSMFTFRSTRIAEALLRAKKRKVKIRVLMDDSQAPQPYMKPYADWLAFHKIPVKLNSGPNPDGPEYAEKNHNKFMVVDGKVVETGSMNWTKNAFLMGFENANFIDDAEDAASYAAFFDAMYRDRRAKRLAAPEEAPTLPTDEELVDDLLVEPAPLPGPKTWPALPDPGAVELHGARFPKAAARPQDPVKDLLVQAVRTAKTSIHLALYEFNLSEVLDALRQAKADGLEVRVVLDYAHVFPRGLNHAGVPRERSAEIQALLDEGFDVRMIRGDGSYGTMHNKFAVFDGAMAEFGSYNWTYTSEENHFENVGFATEEGRVAGYLAYWEWLYERGLSFEDASVKRPAWPDVGPSPAPAELPLEFNGARLPLQAFSPRGMVEDAIIRSIEAARYSVQIAMFSFYSQPIADALLRAKRRGIPVQLVLDSSQAKMMKLDDWFAYHDFDVKLVAGPDDFGNVMFEKTHHKFMVVDGRLVETGSFNYSANAQNNNFENANWFLDALLAAFYVAVFRMLYDIGWKPFKPSRPPEVSRPDADFFAEALPEDVATFLDE